MTKDKLRAEIEEILAKYEDGEDLDTAIVLFKSKSDIPHGWLNGRLADMFALLVHSFNKFAEQENIPAGELRGMLLHMMYPSGEEQQLAPAIN